MGLFARGADEGVVVGQEASPRAGWTRERGTAKLILWFMVFVVGWWVFGKIHDHFLLQTRWQPLSPELDGLTVVGTLDARGDYEHNLFRIIQANQTAKVELTEYGWNSIFDDKNGTMFSTTNGGIINGVQNIDDETAYRMLEPYLRAGIAMNLGRTDWRTLVTPSTPVTIQIQQGKTFSPEQTTLGALLQHYSQQNTSKEHPQETDPTEAGSGSARSVDHGMTIAADSLAVTCPIILLGSHFSDASYDENPATMFDGKSYTIHLELTEEGRSRFFQWSSKHANESLVFVLKHQVATAGRVKDTMNVSEWDIGPIHDVEMAKAIVEYVKHQKR